MVQFTEQAWEWQHPSVNSRIHTHTHTHTHTLTLWFSSLNRPESGNTPIAMGTFRAEVSFLVTQLVKNLPTMQETQVRPLGRQYPLEKGMAIHSNILAWRIPWTEEPGRLLSMGLQRVRHNWATNTFTFPLSWLLNISHENDPGSEIRQSAEK